MYAFLLSIAGTSMPVAMWTHRGDTWTQLPGRWASVSRCRVVKDGLALGLAVTASESCRESERVEIANLGALTAPLSSKGEPTNVPELLTCTRFGEERKGRTSTIWHIRWHHFLAGRELNGSVLVAVERAGNVMSYAFSIMICAVARHARFLS